MAANRPTPTQKRNQRRKETCELRKREQAVLQTIEQAIETDIEQTMAKPRVLTFFDFPHEVRNLVYQYYFSSPKRLWAYPVKLQDPISVSWTYRDVYDIRRRSAAVIDTQIFQVSKQVFAEAPQALLDTSLCLLKIKKGRTSPEYEQKLVKIIDNAPRMAIWYVTFKHAFSEHSANCVLPRCGSYEKLEAVLRYLIFARDMVGDRNDPKKTIQYLDLLCGKSNKPFPFGFPNSRDHIDILSHINRIRVLGKDRVFNIMFGSSTDEYRWQERATCRTLVEIVMGEHGDFAYGQSGGAASCV